ncbi:PAAR domain-containing protein [Paraburkholderia sp. BL10I2N1]|uniref:PAAR domain-containing protein n=1 Tax=Paraburkholderia sp. BL10I2N1 TaxID=1938796 RepID=UPI0010E67888|nr:PAAR domain-containing protein [Paraburkholderia sp. BL10I2N1]TDN62568.1 PAAR motif-containing protein [Paraburkholderia sp. BL10I2N1]
MRKAAVRNGDPTTTGGFVIGSSTRITDHGKKVALDGDVATCGNCKGTHRIFGTGKGISDKGRNVVVDGDSVLCPCGKNWVIVGSNPGYFLNTDRGSAGASNAASAAQSVIVTGAPAATYDEQFTLTDAAGKALADTYYTVRLPSGELQHGITDSSGRTARYKTDGAQRLRVYMGHKEA